MQPQLATKVDGLLVPLARGWVMEPKMDGNRIIAIKKGDTITIAARSGEDVTPKLPHLVKALALYPDDCILDGELVAIDSFERVAGKDVPRVLFYRTAEVMQSNPHRAMQIQLQHGALSFIVFDCLSAKGVDLLRFPDSYRRSALKLICEVVKVNGDTEYPWVIPIPRYEHWNQEVVEYFIEMGFEGAMLKDPKAFYVPGKRANCWQKYKAVSTADVVVMGFNPGKKDGNWRNLVGSIEFGQYKNGKLVKRGQCSGFSMELRHKLTTEGALYIGKVMEVKYMGQSGKSKNGIRHPQFLRFRDDKKAEECTWETV